MTLSKQHNENKNHKLVQMRLIFFYKQLSHFGEFDGDSTATPLRINSSSESQRLRHGFAIKCLANPMQTMTTPLRLQKSP